MSVLKPGKDVIVHTDFNYNGYDFEEGDVISIVMINGNKVACISNEHSIYKIYLDKDLLESLTNNIENEK